eukprot:CAMPEP_0174250880 /NCGR_PEP_ID=MMETSP0439-20130205/902_1 /TAXON_ID=0 /ORGANISM="Stereomyxa ramosa, Strain Chinc5" /LENGTH=467 /DNA_ID=CAMNT_0015331057 /DNA_START=18 /DNA_END=1421 /DNA_ORIENTATION=-
MQKEEATDKKTEWGDLDDELDAEKLVQELQGLKCSGTDEGNEEEEPAPATGLDDTEAEVQRIPDQDDPNSPLYSVNNFEDILKDKPDLLKGVYDMGFNYPSKIQGVSLPILLGQPPKNLIAQAQSGTGKTAAFSLTMLCRTDPNLHKPQCLCVCPTRELARQIYTVVNQIGKNCDFVKNNGILLAVPGEKTPRSITSQIIIGTPGKITLLLKKRELEVDNIKVFVLDEADEMLEKQGLKDQSLRIKGYLRDPQVLLFSATYRKEVAQFAQRFVPLPRESIRLQKKELTLDKITQLYIDCKSEDKKFDILSSLYEYLTIAQSIIFVQRRDTADSLARKMQQEGHAVSVLHGGMEPSERDFVIDEFREGKTKVLISTNVLSRGIDILQISLVINYDLPLDKTNKPDYSTYVHRIGRSGRFGRLGVAVNFVHDSRSMQNLQDIQAFFGRQIKQLAVDQIEQLDSLLRSIS